VTERASTQTLSMLCASSKTTMDSASSSLDTKLETCVGVGREEKGSRE
jgi:hypothetical protein